MRQHCSHQGKHLTDSHCSHRGEHLSSSDRSHGTEHLSASNRSHCREHLSPPCHSHHREHLTHSHHSHHGEHLSPPCRSHRREYFTHSHCSFSGSISPLPTVHTVESISPLPRSTCRDVGSQEPPEEAFCGAEVLDVRLGPTESKAAPEHIPSVLGTSWCQEQAPCAHS